MKRIEGIADIGAPGPLFGDLPGRGARRGPDAARERALYEAVRAVGNGC